MGDQAFNKMTDYYKDKCFICGRFLKWNNSNTVCEICKVKLDEEAEEAAAAK